MAKRSKSHSQGGESVEVYRGYLIRPAGYGTLYLVQKDGVTIYTGTTSAQAHEAIDAVVG